MESTSGSERLDTHHPRAREHGPWLLVAGFAVLAVLIAAAGYWAWGQQSQSMRSQAERSLVAIGELKAGQISAWMQERQADAAVLRDDPLLSAAAADIIAERDAVSATTSVQTYLGVFRRSYDYKAIVMTSPKGAVLLSAPQAASSPLSAQTKAIRAKATATGRVQSSDLYQDAEGKSLLDLVAPILGADGSVIATVILRSHLDHVLYPLIQHWPLPSKSGETLLVKRRGDQVVYLNELRHRKNTAFKLTAPLNTANLPAAMAVRGGRGVAQGVDYRDVPVLSAVQPVPGTPWFIVAKEDTDEVLGAIRTRGWLTAGFALLLIALAGVGTLFIWRRRESMVSAEIRESEERLKEAQSIARLGRWELDLVHDRLHWSDGIFLIFEIDPVRFGASYEAFLDGIHPDDRGAVDRAYSASLESKQPYEVTHRLLMKDGRVKWVHETCRSDFDAGGRPLRSVGVVQDVTEQMRAEEALRRSEMELRTLLENLPAGVVVHAPDTTILLSNPRASELLGLTADQLQGKTAKDPEWRFLRENGTAMPFEDYPVQQALSSGRALSDLVVGVRRPGGSEPVWLLSNAYPIRDTGGELLQFVVTFIDITDRKNAEAARQKFVMLADSSSEFIGMCDLEMTPLYVNPAGLRMVGLPDMAAACHVQVQDYFFPEDQRFIAEEFFPHVLRESHGDVEIRLRHFQTGEPIWTFYYLFSIRDASGEVVGWATVSRDVTERKQAAEALAASEEKHRALFETMSEGIVYADADGTITSANPAAERLLGLSLDQMRGRTSLDPRWKAIHEDGSLWPGETHPIPTVLKTGKPIADEVQGVYNPQSGEYVWLSVNAIPEFLPGEQQPFRAYAVFHDITERKQAKDEVSRLNSELEQRVLERTAELDAANKELEAFAYTVSHDLRAPLRHISGFSSLLTKRAGDSLDEKSRHYVDTISNSVREMGVLIDDLLQFSRTGRAELRIEPVDMNAALAEALAPLQHETEDRVIDWSIGTLPSVMGDRALLRQVWANLLGNAVKYTRGRTPARIEVGARAANGEDIFFVRDNGVGFDMQYAHKLFGVFQRLHSASEFEGTGIGLANVQRIVTRLGGRAWAEAEVDRGATFFFSLHRQKECS